MGNVENVSKDIAENLKYMYFGNISNKIRAASNRAFLDFCRTIRYDKLEEKKKEIKEKTTVYIENEISGLLSKDIKDHDDFDLWHQAVCEKIISNFSCEGHNLKLTNGQAQKWLNMTIKYLFFLGLEFGGLIQYLHVPIDSVVIKMAREQFNIEIPNIKWSKWDNYTEYLELQKDIRKHKNNPFLWELQNWYKQAYK